VSLLLPERPRTAPPRTVRGSLLFLVAAQTKPALTYGAGAAAPETDATYRSHDVFIRDARLYADHLQLDGHGFKLVSHVSGVRDFDDEDEVLTRGRDEAADIVAASTGATHVFVFDHTRRRRAPDAARQPSTRVHVDYTEISAPQRVRDFFGPGAERMLRSRVAFINVWRPLKWPAEDWPLALAYANSVAPDELIATDLVYPDRRGEIYGLCYNPAQRWAYVPNMRPDEALLIKCYDSRGDVARFTPHTAFADPTARADAPPRHSIEFRTIAFFD
jgi:hypothetical protein